MPEATVDAPPPQERAALFPSFWMAGFECSSHLLANGRREDYVAITQHDRFCGEDYDLLQSVGMHVVREGLRWHLIDECGRYDFSSVAAQVEAAHTRQMVQIWDLFHYGYPDDLDPLNESFVPRFAELAYRFGRWLRERAGAPRFYVPLNEPSFYSWAAGETGWFAPFLVDRGWELKMVMARAGLAATEALRAADPGARLIAVDPLIHVHAPAGAPDLEAAAAVHTGLQFQVWEMLAGKLEPAFGGSPAGLDIIGVNYYPHSQFELTDRRPLALDDPRRRPFRDLLVDLYARYGRPIVVTETAANAGLRPVWLSSVVDECLAALRLGVDLQGICLYPIIDFPDWGGGDPIQFGLWDVVTERDATGPILRRVVNTPYLEALRRSQRRLAASGLLPIPPHVAGAWTSPPQPLHLCPK